MVNIVGQHTTSHLRYDAPLTADIEAFARPVSGYVCTVDRAENMGAAASAAIAAAYGPPGQVSTLIVPADFSWRDSGDVGAVVGRIEPLTIETESLRQVVQLIRSGEPVGLLLGGSALLKPGLKAAGQLAAGTSVRIIANRYAARVECGAGLYNPPRLAYFPEMAEPMLGGLKHLILIESKPPISFFGYPGCRSYLAPEDCAVHTLAPIGGDGVAALQELVEGCGVGSLRPNLPELLRPTLPTSFGLTPDSIGQAIAESLPPNAIVSDEMVSSGEPISRQLLNAFPHDHLPVTGGSIGQGLPVAVGAAVACPDRKVIALEADGSGMYTLQALWTMAREQLDVVTVILSNRRYRILEIEMQRTGAGAIGEAANDMIDIGRPDIDWVKLSQGMGVRAVRVMLMDEFIKEFRKALSRRGPALIEAVIG